MERYAKARMLHQDEARDEKIRELYAYFEEHGGTREDAFGATILFHRLVVRMDVQGAVCFEPSWMWSECFLGHPVKADEVARWADALVAVGLLEPYVVKGLRYAWSRAFYKNNPGLNLNNEDPRYPRPPGFDIRALWPKNRPGPVPSPAWDRGRRGRDGPPYNDDEDDETPPSALPVLGGVSVVGGTQNTIRAIARLERDLTEPVAKALRRYALQFDEREDGAVDAVRYRAILATIDMWRQEGGVYFRGCWVPWDPERYAAAFRHVSELVLDGRMKSHQYVRELLVDPSFPPRADERPAGAPDPDKRGRATARRDAAISAENRRREREVIAANDQWRMEVDRWLAAHPDEAKHLREQVRRELAKQLKGAPKAAQELFITSRLRMLAAEHAGIRNPFEKEGGENR